MPHSRPFIVYFFNIERRHSVYTFQNYSVASEVAQRIEMFTAEPNDLNSIPRRKLTPTSCPLTSKHMPWPGCPPNK